jgi:NitT/TauT family transport system permease protein
MSASPTTEPAARARSGDASGDAVVLRAYQRRRSREKHVVWTAWVVLGIVVLAGWQLASGTIIDTIWISSPSLVAERLGTWFSDGTVWPHIWATLLETSLGFSIGTCVALAVAIPLGLLPVVYRILAPYLTALYALPKITLAPLMIIYLGIGLQMKVVVCAIVAFWMIFFNTLDAVRSLDRDLTTVVRVAGASRLQMLRVMILPSALGGILVGMKLALPYTLNAALFAEILASNQGLGYLVQLGSSQFDLTAVFAALILVEAIAVPLSMLVDYVERFTQRWRLG